MKTDSDASPEKSDANWKHHLFQGVAAALTVLVILLILNFEHKVVIGSISASAFIVFAMPRAESARPRNMILGHGIGLLVGVTCYYLPSFTPPFDMVNYALAITASFFIFALAKINHPPAVATAFGVAEAGISFELVGILIATVVILSIIQVLLGPHMKHLL